MFENYIPLMENADRQERGRLLNEIMDFYGCSKDTVYRELKKAGWTSGRSRRKDAGQSGVSAESLEALGALISSSVRKNGKVTMGIPTARHILEMSGYRFGVSNTRLAALLRERNLDIKTQSAPETYTRMRSLHPNHVHQVDPSLCLLYYLPRGGQRIIEDNEAYKNKPFLENKTHLKIWRYVLTDHYSSSICVRYYQMAGESMEALWKFLLYAWREKNDPEYLFHGVPEILVLDKGSANMGGGVVNGLNALRIKQIPHAVGNPRAKGQVENANNLVETLFESRLKTEPVSGVDELNEKAEQWCAAYNANILQGYDSTLNRAGKSRRELWLHIQPEQLRELPEEAESILAAKPVTRKVGGDLTVSFSHPKIGESLPYRVGGLEGIRAGMTVQVQPILMDAGGALRVIWKYQGEEFAEEVTPVEINEAGFWEDAAVFGENFKSNKDTVVDIAAKRLAELIGEEKIPFARLNNGEGLKPISRMTRRESNIAHIPRVGNTINPGEAPDVTVNFVEAARRLKTRLKHWDPAWLQVIQDNFPQGVPESKLDDLAETLNGLGGEHGNEVRFG